MPLASVLFVCLGNICRSPLAEAAFRAAADAARLPVEVDSAGTGGWHAGDPPDRRAIAEARRHGVAIGDYRARQIRAEDFTRFDYIFALDHSNLKDLQAITPANATASVGLLMDLVPGRAGQPVADPYYGGPDDFAETWADVSLAAAMLVQRLRG
ncbi:low molecular weight phosphotyrosine protein phosphatase [Novosphingobium sp. FSY-8]|uniref:protein-tyrosine-phosphatase n=1 Tax=Novosphingobium ovatum TaxID=1908523 RepID=A0ABW9XGS5_9SPHN|nr:low molecular weight protein-tyrosine-phosphatase [Novosphingobium ovatum]NBC37762.1 low molecular weight phosphotyrosine protein phosphatase [Novosphingobium ovatum]